MLSNFARLKILRRKTNLCLIHRTISTGGFQWDIPEKFNFAQDVIDAYAKGGLISEDWSHLHKNLPNHYLQLLHFWLHVQVDHNSLIVLFLSMEPN